MLSIGGEGQNMCGMGTETGDQTTSSRCFALPINVCQTNGNKCFTL